MKIYLSSLCSALIAHNRSIAELNTRPAREHRPKVRRQTFKNVPPAEVVLLFHFSFFALGSGYAELGNPAFTQDTKKKWSGR